MFDENPQFDGKSTDELLAIITDGHGVIDRGNAIIALGRRLEKEPELVGVLESLARSPEMRSLRIFHAASLAYFVIGALVRLGTPESLQAARRGMDGLSDVDLEGLEFFLRSGGWSLTQENTGGTSASFPGDVASS
ncbi:hypothetical protein [Candidatus Protofrankia californiensis]|uniref:hypothetical protein n=1 Tax=Candidatus Protofrankia californiensis TaxID=1839754 RepID=UPI0010413BCE|nr:hypothetical protein [Candidatus Protofrankia californiensis]